jgi:CelD/BcsL family acetyltransferase involved in cellulose biosynthesis
VLNPRSINLNETGDSNIDPLGLEYNSLLVDRRLERQAVVQAALTGLIDCDLDWDELNLGGILANEMGAWISAADRIGLQVQVRARSKCHHVTLGKTRPSKADYLRHLSRNTRQQVRRALRLYEKHGPVSITPARDDSEAKDFLADLKKLHQASWTRRGHAGAFANEVFERFHRDLIEDRFDAGEIQLLRCSAGASAFGYLYNIVRNGWVYAYQSGFRYQEDSRLKPGLVSHCLAIKHNSVQGNRVYDFMAGDSQYKRSLGTDCLDMTWVAIQRPRARLRLEKALRGLKRRLVGQADAC